MLTVTSINVGNSASDMRQAAHAGSDLLISRPARCRFTFDEAFRSDPDGVRSVRTSTKIDEGPGRIAMPPEPQPDPSAALGLVGVDPVPACPPAPSYDGRSFLYGVKERPVRVGAGGDGERGADTNGGSGMLATSTVNGAAVARPIMVCTLVRRNVPAECRPAMHDDSLAQRGHGAPDRRWRIFRRMSEQPSTHNELRGNVRGPVVQSGAIHGDVVFNSPAAPRDPESVEVDRRWDARRQRILDAEDAQRAESQRRAHQYVRVCRRKRRINAVLLLVAGVTLTLGLMQVVPELYAAVGALYGAVSVIGWARCTLIIRNWDAGRTIRVPRSRWRW
ncbi:hypothetical protein AB0E64_26590 [Streptomyces caelestis]|uniref:Uncharacterized protein n=2 Tax=Streptomyces caelestis TaxID=36816 RepID=A0A7W9H4Q0_9ACTN|nr:hypothetical protein [Streptomyces caelestis]MBB5795338.1 hypothetical protein [Streptomyces caelestis]